MDFEKLYYRYYNEIHQFAFSLCFSRSKSDDLVQDTFFSLFKELKKGVELENPRAWLYKVTLNQWRNEYKQNRTIRAKNIQSNWSEINNHTPETEFINQEKRRLVFERLEELPVKDRDILVLYQNGLSYAEIADVLDMKPRSVGTTLSRSIQRFKSKLKIKHNELFE